MAWLPAPDEAAAIAAAIERFRAETSPVADEAEAALGAWRRAALVEGVTAKSSADDLEGKGVAKWLS